MKRKSLGFKLISMGILTVVVPLLILGFISMKKTSTALTTISKEQVQDIAQDLAEITKRNVMCEFIQIGILSDKHIIHEIMSAKLKNNEEELKQLIPKINQNLYKTLQNMGENYEGIFLTDTNGNIFAGIQHNGKLYTNIDVADREYFQKAVESQKTSMGNLVRSKVSDAVVGSICSPLIDSQSQQLMGTICLTVKMDSMIEILSSRKIGKTGYVYMADKNGLVLSHPKKEHILTLNMTKLEGMETFYKEMTSGESGVSQYTFMGTKKISGFAPVEINDWFIAVTQDRQEFLQAVKSIKFTIIIVSVIAVIISGILLFINTKAITDPVNAAVEGLKDIAQGEGDLTMRLELKTKDEIGELVLWFNTFMEKMQDMIKQIGQTSKQVGDSSLELTSISTKINTASDQVSEKSDNVASATEEMTSNINNVAAAMEQSATNINMVASAGEEMNSTIAEIAENAENARNISSNAVDQSAKASKRMENLGQAAQSIGEVTETITEISQQTNLLSLNATIEAARAGEAGKGFAVVANEIKELSIQTSKATLDIKNKIDEVQSSVGMSITDINEITEVITKVNDIISAIAAAIEQQTSATSEITQNITQASIAINEVNERINQNAEVANMVAKDISDVSSESNDIAAGINKIHLNSETLKKMSDELNNIVGRFKV